MSIEQIMAKERRATEEAIIKGNLNALDEVFAADAVSHIPPFPDIHGLDGFKQYIVGFGPVLSDIRWNWDEVICKDNTAVQRFTMKGKHAGRNEICTVQPTGKEVVIQGCAIYHLKNGKIVEFIEHTDYLGAFQQFGMIPPMG